MTNVVGKTQGEKYITPVGCCVVSLFTVYLVTLMLTLMITRVWQAAKSTQDFSKQYKGGLFDS